MAEGQPARGIGQHRIERSSGATDAAWALHSAAMDLAGQGGAFAEDVLAEWLAEAVALLREWGACDPYTGQPYDEVVAFLAKVSAPIP